MDPNAQIRQTWANTLHRWGLANLTAALLDALGPLNLFGAQMVHLSKPVLTTFVPAGHLDALAEVLEIPQTTQAFTIVLRQSENRSPDPGGNPL